MGNLTEPLIQLPTASRLAGVDPFDALRGTRVPSILKRTARSRQVVLQLRKRFPWDLSGVLGVEPFVMAKTVGCALSALSRWHQLGRATPDVVESVKAALDGLEGRSDDGGWGYEFDVQTRWAYYCAGTPNVISTVFVGRGLLEAGLACHRDDWVDEGLSAASYVAQNLFDSGDEPFIRYLAESDTLIHNANALGAGLLAAAGLVGKRDDWIELGLKSCKATLDAQNPMGGWPYGRGGALSWEDNFHTAYTLDGLHAVWMATGDDRIRGSLVKGLAAWESRFFDSEGAPSLYTSPGPPFDIHSAGTAIDVAGRLALAGWGTRDLPGRVRDWTQGHLISDDSTTMYRVGRYGVDQRHFARWGDAHMWLADATYALLVYEKQGSLDLVMERART